MAESTNRRHGWPQLMDTNVAGPGDEVDATA